MGLAPTAPVAGGPVAAAAAPWLTVATATDGAVEVVRGAVADPVMLAAVVAWAAAAAAVVVLTAAVSVGAERRRVIAPVWVVAVAATLTEGVLLLLGGSLTDRRPTAALARLLLLVVGLVGAGALPRWADRLLTVLVLLTVTLGAPSAGGIGGLAATAAVLLVGVGLAAAALWAAAGRTLRARRDGRSTVVALGLVALLAVPAGVAAWPDPSPPTLRTQQVVAEIVFDLTVAPAAPGRNELHLYARDRAGQPVDLTDVRATVAGRPAQELYPVTLDHWLSYVLDLPPGDRWRLTVTAVTTDGDERAVVLDLVAP
jgi:hypothetical protein